MATSPSAGMSNFPGLVYVVLLLYRIFFGRGREVGRELFPITWSVPSLPPGNNHENMRGPDQFRHLGNNVLFGIGISILISVLSGTLPAAKAAKLDPVESLRRD